MMRRTTLLVLLALPATALAQIDNSALECDTSRPTYWARGDRWTPTPPAASVPQNKPIHLYFQPDGPDQSPDITATVIRDAVMTSFQKWTLVDCGSGTYPNLSFDYAGTYATRDGGDDVSANSFKNVIYWVEDSTFWTNQGGSSTTVALTWNLALPTFPLDSEHGTGALLDADMQFNGVNFNWRARSSTTVYGCTEGASNCFDVGSVALHEAGHFIGFNHVQCADAVMYPTGSGIGEVTALSAHEKEGVCKLYPPRSASASTSVPVTYEACSTASATPCSGSDVCIQSEDYKATYPLAWCASPCSTDADCPTAFVCRSQYVTGNKYCSPGVHFADDSSDGGTATPGGTQAMCTACSSGDQCLSGLCVGDGTSSICTDRCLSSSASSSCPDGFDCLATDGGAEICWPEGGVDDCDSSTSTSTSSDTSSLDELCYQLGTDDSGSTIGEWFQPCGAGLICIAFKPHGAVYEEACITLQEGACVLYCSPDRACPTTDGSTSTETQLSCCYGVDQNGQCLGASVADGRVHGGCFDIRTEGQTCVSAEESVCATGTGCYYLDSDHGFRCYRECESSSDCASDQSCAGPYQALCSDTSVSLCDPPPVVEARPVGMICAQSAQCDSGLCQKRSTESACSRSCDLITGAGCPGNTDIDGDGLTDGGFSCLALGTGGAGRCWPNNGPVAVPGDGSSTSAADSGCSCASDRLGAPFELVLAVLVVLGLRRRRRA